MLARLAGRRAPSLHGSAIVSAAHRPDYTAGVLTRESPGYQFLAGILPTFDPSTTHHRLHGRHLSVYQYEEDHGGKRRDLHHDVNVEVLQECDRDQKCDQRPLGAQEQRLKRALLHDRKLRKSRLGIRACRLSRSARRFLQPLCKKFARIIRAVLVRFVPGNRCLLRHVGNHARCLLARAVKNSSLAQSSQSEAYPSKNFALPIRSPAWWDARMTLKGIKGLSIAALAGIASVAAAPARADGDAAARIEVGFSTAYRASTFAAQMVGRPYRTGGAAPGTGFDCSGLVQFSFGQAGVILPRSAAEQRQAAARVRVSHLRHGDLLFFDLQGKRNSHVGIYVGDGQFVPAPRPIMIAS